MTTPSPTMLEFAKNRVVGTVGKSYDHAEKAIAFAVAKGNPTGYYLALYDPSPEAVTQAEELRKFIRAYCDRASCDKEALRDYLTWGDLECFAVEAERIATVASTLNTGAT